MPLEILFKDMFILYFLLFKMKIKLIAISF
nr:MAG TPA: hypothetical protein [Caudoviricetes sp.]